MPIFTVLTILVIIGSLTFCLMTLNRLFTYNKKYNLKAFESGQTKLFGVIEKEHIVIIYVLLTLMHLIFTVWFIWTM